MGTASNQLIIEAIVGERVLELERVQSLWDGYGEIVRATLASGPVVVKSVRPRAGKGVSHARKCRSYDVELAFYRNFATRCDDDDGACRVAKLLFHRVAKNEWTFVFEDLDAAGFGARDRDPTGARLDACLAWLAAFHARFLGVRPDGLWSVGTYWHLETRQEELAAMQDDDLRRRAPELDRRLREARFQTLVHGDAKPANFCFGEEGGVAAVDFQYVGGGCGMKDVAYLLHGSNDEEQCLDTYFRALNRPDVEAEWRPLYPIARLDFERFLAGWRM